MKLGHRFAATLSASAAFAVVGASCLFARPALAASEEDAALIHARALLASTILVDGHNDLP